MLIHTVAQLCGLAAVVFATASRGRRGVAALSAGFLCGLGLPVPSPGWTGALVAAMAVLVLIDSRSPTTALAGPLASGLTGGMCAQMLVGQGMATWLAWPLAAGFVAASAFASQRNPRFARREIREDALAALAALGLAVAAAPSVAAGWRTAGVMNLAANDLARPGPNSGLLLGVAAVVVLGGLHRLRRRA